LTQAQVTASVDAMGGDHGPGVVIRACREAHRCNPHLHFLLHGDERLMGPELKRCGLSEAAARVQHTDKRVLMDEKPALALRRGKGSSMWNAVDAVRQGQADLVISAGNTGAFWAIARLLLGMRSGLDRPALVSSIPNRTGFTTFLDVGANIECDAARLVEFAIMGDAFHRAAHAVGRPRVGLLNITPDPSGASEVLQRAHEQLGNAGLELNYRGLVAPGAITTGEIDVVVTDGFTGNIALKAMEGTVRLVGGSLRDALSQNPAAVLGALLAQRPLNRVKQRFNRAPAGVLVGLNRLAVKSHGAANVGDFALALGSATDLVTSNFGHELDRSLARLQPAALH
jgi:glycerol-3-phosphate acyltransferase PlsX